jgi:predicted Zn-dependent protease
MMLYDKENMSCYLKAIVYFLVFISITLSGCAGLNYNVLTGEESLTFISEEKEVKLGRKIAKEVEKEYEIIRDPRIRDVVKSIGYRLAENCDRRGLLYHFEVIRKKKDRGKEEPNAFALPGGYIYINDKLFDLIGQDNEDEIAAVLAHEISHIVLRHNILKLQEAIGTQALLIIIGTRAEDAATVRRSNIALILMMLAYTKEREIEADLLALRYLRDSGYDPKAIISLFEKLKEYQFNSPIKPYYIKTHPYMDERIEIVKRELKAERALKD